MLKKVTLEDEIKDEWTDERRKRTISKGNLTTLKWYQR